MLKHYIICSRLFMMLSLINLYFCSFIRRFHQSALISYSYPSIEFCSDLYEGTRMAQNEDLSGIKQIIQPLEASGILVKRTDEEVCLTIVSVVDRYMALHSLGNLSKHFSFSVYSCYKLWTISLLWKEKVK